MKSFMFVTVLDMLLLSGSGALAVPRRAGSNRRPLRSGAGGGKGAIPGGHPLCQHLRDAESPGGARNAGECPIAGNLVRPRADPATRPEGKSHR